MSRAETFTGGCLCGAVRYEAHGPADSLCFCHCASCRRAAGATPVAWGTFPLAGFRVVRGALARFRSSEPVERGFCGACGSTLTYAHRARPEAVDITLASLDRPEALAPACHIWLADHVAWAAPADELPRFAGWRADG